MGTAYFGPIWNIYTSTIEIWWLHSVRIFPSVLIGLVEFGVITIGKWLQKHFIKILAPQLNFLSPKIKSKFNKFKNKHIFEHQFGYFQK